MLDNTYTLSIRFKIDKPALKDRKLLSFCINDYDDEGEECLSEILGIIITYNTNLIQYSVNGSYTTTNIKVSQDQYHQLIIKSNGTSIKCYLDGIKVFDKPYSISLLNSMCYLASDDANQFPLNGCIEQFIFSDKELNLAFNQYVLHRIVNEYDNYNRLTSIKYSDNSLEHSYAYGLHEVVKETIKDKWYRYNYDNQLNVTSITCSDGKVDSYEYDSFNRLTKEKSTKANGVTKTKTYSYDSLGNIYCVIDNGNTYQFNYDNTIKSKLMNITKNNNSYATLEYDNLLLSKLSIDNNIYSYTWDKGRLSKVKSNTNETRFNYDVQGHRIEKTTPNETHTYLYDNDIIVKEEIIDNLTNNVITLSYTYDQNSNLVAVEEGNNVYYYIRNILGNIIRINASNRH